MQNTTVIQRDTATTQSAPLPQANGITVGTALTTLDTVFLNGLSDSLWAELLNVGSVAFSDFQVQFQIHPNSSFQTAFKASDFASSPPPLGQILALVSGTDPATLAPSGESFLGLTNIKGLNAVRFQAQVASGSGAATLRTSRAQDA